MSLEPGPESLDTADAADVAEQERAVPYDDER